MTRAQATFPNLGTGLLARTALNRGQRSVGVWNADYSALWEVDDIVDHLGLLYRCATAATASVPGADANWILALGASPYLDFRHDFLIADWVVDDLSVPQATHGMPVGMYQVLVMEDKGAFKENILITTAVNETTGDVTITKSGAAFDGSVLIQLIS